MNAQPFKLTDYRQQPASIPSNEPNPQKTEDYLISIFLFLTVTVFVAATTYTIHQNNRITATIKGLKEDVATLSTLSNPIQTKKNEQSTTTEA